jgi:hypothetical protein
MISDNYCTKCVQLAPALPGTTRGSHSRKVKVSSVQLSEDDFVMRFAIGVSLVSSGRMKFGEMSCDIPSFVHPST